MIRATLIIAVAFLCSTAGAATVGKGQQKPCLRFKERIWDPISSTVDEVANSSE
jgi:hypothetical protein